MARLPCTCAPGMSSCPACVRWNTMHGKYQSAILEDSKIIQQTEKSIHLERESLNKAIIIDNKKAIKNRRYRLKILENRLKNTLLRIEEEKNGKKYW